MSLKNVFFPEILHIINVYNERILYNNLYGTFVIYINGKLSKITK